MNPNSTTHPSFGFDIAARRSPSAAPLSAQDALQARYALRVAAALTERNLQLDADITERLRFARESALVKARRSAGTASAQAARPMAGGRPGGLWLKFASVLPAIALVAGLVLIQRWQDSSQISVAAEIDAAMLSDDVPPAAYSDAGFVEFLKSPSE